MEPAIARRLVDLNRAFYQSFAAPFAETRRRVQPGVSRLLAEVPAGAAVLDLGCGSGNAAAKLAAGGHAGRYLGLDLSPELLAIARTIPLPFPAEFRLANFLEPSWDAALPGQSFDFALAFAVLHHIPGQAGRRNFLSSCRSLLSTGGKLFLSTWQFTRSKRLAARVVPWSEIGLSESDVDAGDYLLDWRRDGHGLRYVHLVTEADRRQLAEETGFREVAAFESDGEGGRLSDYAVCER